MQEMAEATVWAAGRAQVQQDQKKREQEAVAGMDALHTGVPATKLPPGSTLADAGAAGGWHEECPHRRRNCVRHCSPWAEFVLLCLHAMRQHWQRKMCKPGNVRWGWHGGGTIHD
jgi:hypothetical protein